MTKDDIKKNATAASKEVKKADGNNGSSTFKVEQIKSGLDKIGPIRTLSLHEIERGEESPYSQRNRMTRKHGTNIVIVPVAFKGEVYHFKVTFKSIGETDSYNIPRDMDESINAINKHLTK
jgi:hypothetical protein